jgi:hypothetical protein
VPTSVARREATTRPVRANSVAKSTTAAAAKTCPPSMANATRGKKPKRSVASIPGMATNRR